MREMQTFEYNFFSLYKQQGEQPINEDCKLLYDQDLLLVIQTDFNLQC